MMQKPSTISVVENTFGIDLYEDDLLTIAAMEIEWNGDPMEGDASPILVRSTTYYLGTLDALTEDRYVIWNSSDVSPMTLTAAWKIPSGSYVDWDANVPIILTVAEPIVMLRFDLDINGQPAGDYPFAVSFFSAEDV